MADRSYLATIFESHPVSDRMGLRVHRRAAVIALTGWALLVTLLAEEAGVAACLLTFIPLFFLMGIVNMASRGATVLTDGQLDERMRSLRDHAHKQAFVIGVIIAFTVGVYFGRTDVAAGANGWRLAFQLGAATFVVLGMPAMILAWRLPNEPRADE